MVKSAMLFKIALCRVGSVCICGIWFGLPNTTPTFQCGHQWHFGVNYGYMSYNGELTVHFWLIDWFKLFNNGEHLSSYAS